MRIGVLGTGYVGLVAGAGFADFGNDVVCADTDLAKIERLRRGEIPIFEPGLDSLVERNAANGRLRFSADVAEAVAGAEVVVIAVGTPQSETGAADLRHVLAVAEAIGRAMTGPLVVITKSTVPVGTAERVRETIAAQTQHPFSVVSNPEFLKEGDAVNDFMKPDRIIIGTEDERAREVLRLLYAPFVRTNDRLHFMDARSAELTKYAANAMLATRVSFMNELANLAERLGADVEQVRRGLGSDPRIGPKFLFPGTGFGGSCLIGRETVLIREQGRVRLARIESLFPATHVPTSSVHEPKALEVLALSPGASAPDFRRVRTMTRRPFEGEIREVRTKMGRRVRCTPDHPFVVTDETGTQIGIRRADELSDRDWLPLANGAASNERVSEAPFDLLADLEAIGIEPADVIVRTGGHIVDPIVAESVRGAVASSQRWHDVKRSGTLRLDEARRAGLDLDAIAVAIGTRRSGTYVPARIPNTPAFWRVMGLYCAEGWVTADVGRDGAERLRVFWAFHPRDEQHLVDEVVAFWRALGVEAAVLARPTTMQVSISSRIFARWLLRILGPGKDCYEKRVPDRIWTASAACKRAFLSGLWQGDGSWSYVGNRRGVVWEYGTVSRDLADGILRLLAEQGVVASWKIGRPPKSTVDTHFLRISGAAQVERLLDFGRPDDHGAIVDSIAMQTKRIAPTGWRERPARVRVASVERRPFQGHVYSLEVPGADTFVTTGALVVHNCFPKDLKALIHLSHEVDLPLEIIGAVDRVNARQKTVLATKIEKHFGGELAGRTIAVWGLAFKPKTDDIREAPALSLIERLVAAGARVVAHDPAAMENVRAILGDQIAYAPGMYEAIAGADALALVTEWHEYRRPDFHRIRRELAAPVVFDGRNIWDPAELRALGYTYHGIGRR